MDVINAFKTVRIIKLIADYHNSKNRIWFTCGTVEISGSVRLADFSPFSTAYVLQKKPANKWYISRKLLNLTLPRSIADGYLTDRFAEFTFKIWMDIKLNNPEYSSNV